MSIEDSIKGTISSREILVLALILALGLFLRLYAFHFDPVINPDGTLYIQQAKALYYGKFGAITACYPYLSVYPILICLCQFILHDWVLAGVTASLFFALLTTIPLFLLLRQFLDESEALLSILVFSVTPAFVVYSHQVIRGPVFWCFSVLGLYLFTRSMDTKRIYYPCLSCICFMIATWARLEGTLFILLTPIWILFTEEPEHRMKALASFLFPILVISGAVLTYSMAKGMDILKVLPLDAFFARAKGTLKNYYALREQLKMIGESEIAGRNHYFFGIMRKMLWLVAAGAVVRQIIRTVFIPFSAPLVLGIFCSWDMIRKNKGLAYLSFLSIGALVVLFVQTLFNWAIHGRHVAIFLFPAFVFLGIGLKKIIEYLGAVVRWDRKYLVILLGACIFVAPLKKNLSTSRGKDKLVYRAIGRFIAQSKPKNRKVVVAGVFKRVNLIHFYANEKVPDVVCFPNEARLNAKTISPDAILEKQFDYYVWDEKSAPHLPLTKFHEILPNRLIELGRWKTKKRGKIVLFKVSRG